MGIRERLRRLEERAEGEIIVIPQRDGPPARFPKEALRDAFTNLMDRLGAGEDAPPEHPMIEAARNSDDPKWTESFYNSGDPDGWTAPVPDLSE